MRCREVKQFAQGHWILSARVGIQYIFLRHRFFFFLTPTAFGIPRCIGYTFITDLLTRRSSILLVSPLLRRNQLEFIYNLLELTSSEENLVCFPQSSEVFASTSTQKTGYFTRTLLKSWSTFQQYQQHCSLLEMQMRSISGLQCRSRGSRFSMCKRHQKSLLEQRSLGCTPEIQ